MTSATKSSKPKTLPSKPIWENLTPASTETFIVNRSNEKVIITVLLPGDATPQRNLVISVHDKDSLARASAPNQVAQQEQALGPGEMAMLRLRTLPPLRHISLFRARKEGQAGSCFLKYSVQTTSPNPQGTIAYLEAQNSLGKLESATPHLLFIW